MAKSTELLNKVKSLSEESKYREVIDMLTEKQLDNLNDAELYFYRGWAHHQLSETELAKSYSEKALETKPELKDDLNLAGNNFYAENEYQKAIIEYDKAILLDAHFGIAHYNKGLALYNVNKFDSSIIEFTKTIELDKNYYLAYNSRGRAFYSMNDYENAVLDYTKAISIKNDYKDAFLNRGLVWYYKNDLAKAIADYDTAIKIDENYSLAFSNRGLAWYNLYNYDKAISDYNKAILLNPDSKDAFLNRGIVWYDKGEYEKAIADYDKAIEIDENYIIAYNNRGLAWHYLGDYSKAIADYDKTIALDPEYTDAFINRGVTYYYKGQYNKAIEDYNTAIGQNAKLGFVYFNIGLAHFNLGNYSKVIENQNKALELQPDYPDAYNSRGNAWYFTGDLDRAEDDFEEVSKFPGFEAIGYSNLGDVCSSRGEFQQAGDFYEKAKQVDENPDWLRKHIVLRIETNEQRIIFEKAKIPKETLSQTVRLEDWIDITVERIKKHSKSDAQHVVHYTKLFVSDIYVKSLSSKMHYSNALYLNDPMEGKIIFKYFDDDKITQAYINGEKRNESSVYVGSFLPAVDLEQGISFEDELVMWRTYGKDINGREAAGCSIVLSSEFFKEMKKPVDNEQDSQKVATIQEEDSKTTSNDEELLKVVYIKTRGYDRTIVKDQGGNIKILLDELKGYLQSLMQMYDEYKEQKEFQRYLENKIFKKLSRINFLFKSADYNFENEVRVIRDVLRDSNLIHSLDIQEPNLPPKRFYIESANIVLPYIRKIFLGPKVENHQHWGLYFDFEIRQRAKELSKKEPASYKINPSNINISKSECEFQ